MAKNRRTHALKSDAATQILLEEDLAIDPPYCLIPENFFSYAIAKKAMESNKRILLSVSTWDGRDVISISNRTD